jgi:hypothetical protein
MNESKEKEKPKEKIYCDICSYPNTPIELYSLRDDFLVIKGYIKICRGCMEKFGIGRY